jgi:hypothetical protein
MKQTRQPVHAIKQSIYLDGYGEYMVDSSTKNTFPKIELEPCLDHFFSWLQQPEGSQ